MSIHTGIGMPHLQSSLKWKVDKFDSGCQEIPAVWDALNGRCRQHHPLLSAMFAGALSRYFGNENLYLATLTVGGSYAAVALLSRVSQFHWEVFRPGQAPLGLVVVDEELVSTGVAARSLLKALPGYALQLDLLCLDPWHFTEPGEEPYVESVPHAQTMAVHNGRDFDGYLNTRPKSLRSNLRRYERRLNDEGKSWYVRCIESVDDMGAAVGGHGDLEAAGWKGAAGTAIAGNTVQGRFYNEIMCEEAIHGRALAFQIFIDGTLAASRLILLGDNIAVMLKTAYDENLARFAVGRILLKKTIEAMFDRSDVEWIEFYTNASVDQLQWCTHDRVIEHRSCYRNASVRPAKRIAKSARSWFRLPSRYGDRGQRVHGESRTSVD